MATVNGASNSGFEVAVGDTRIVGLYASSSVAVLNAFANVPMQFSTNNSTRMTIDTSGNLLIGATSQNGIITAVGSSQISHKYTGSSSVLFIGQYNSSGDASINNTANGPLVFGTNNTERARIDSSGNFGLACTPRPWVGINAFEVNTGSTTGTAFYAGTGNGAYIGNNLYWDSTTGWTTAYASRASTLLSAINGAFTFQRANAGTPGAAASLTEIVSIGANGLHTAASNGVDQYALDTSGTNLSIANNAVGYPSTNANNFSGLIIVNDVSSTGNVAVFVTGGLAISLISQTGSYFSVTAGTSGKYNVYVSGTSVVIENKSGGTVTFNVMMLRTRASQ
jgi:hypothetical protein